MVEVVEHLIADLVAVVHQVAMFMILLLLHGFLPLEAVEEEVEVHGMLVEILGEMVEIGKQ